MSNDNTEPSKKLLLARKILDNVDGYQLVEDWTYNEVAKLWGLRFTLSHDFKIEELDCTNWYLTTTNDYPADRIKIYPANDLGIKCTYQHQEYNQTSKDGIPWQTGAPCLDEPFRVVGRDSSLEEPIGSIKDRLLWHVSRLRDWLELAATDNLTSNGQAFEVPPLPFTSSKNTIVVLEDTQSIKQWESLIGQTGIVSMYPYQPDNGLFISHFFKRGKTTIINEWGQKIGSDIDYRYRGIWLLLENIPVTCHWRLPLYWGELRIALESQGVDLQSMIKERSDSIRSSSKQFLMIGFPIPELVEQKPKLIYWNALELPKLSPPGSSVPNGFRPNTEGYWRNDQRLFVDEMPLRWVPTENWSEEQIARRGSASEALTKKKFLIVGVGALGSVVAEQLIKLGVKEIHLVDGDDLNGGNLVRHPLGMDDVGKNKAKALTDVLNKSMPHAYVSNSPDRFDESSISDCDVIVDCTGSDEFLTKVENTEWGDETTEFISLAFGVNLDRLFCYHLNQVQQFSYQNFLEIFAPWQERDSSEHPGFTLPKEGIGCWHPAFPGRYDDVTMWASIAVKQVEVFLNQSSTEQQLEVYKKTSDEDGNFNGIIKDSL